VPGVTVSPAARSARGRATVTPAAVLVPAIFRPVCWPVYATLATSTTVKPAGVPTSTLTRNVTVVFSSLSRSPPVVGVAPAPMRKVVLPCAESVAKDPVSSPAASVTAVPAMVSEPGTYVVPAGTASVSTDSIAVSPPSLTTSTVYSISSPGSRSPPSTSRPASVAVRLGAYRSVVKVTTPG
jgi:hypothetical protein